MKQVQLLGAEATSVRVQGTRGIGECNFPIWAAIDPGRHIRICGNPVETRVPAEETR